MAYNSQADELFYGGAAGGGKTDLVLGLAGTAHWQSIIYRRVFPAMRSMIERSREIYNAVNDTHAKDSFNESLHIWRLSTGRMIELASMQHEKDKRNHIGRPHDLYAFDELPEFLQSQYRFVIAWNRTTRPGQRCRVVATGNPPTSADGEWVIPYWGPWLDDTHKHPAKAGELRWYATVEGVDVEREDGAAFEFKGEILKPKSRTFIPARLSDNPYLAMTDYGTILQNLPEPLRSQLLRGDWKAGVKDDPWQIIPTEWVRQAQKRWGKMRRPDVPMTQLGVDVARGGDDQTVLAPRFGVWFAPLQKYAGTATPNGPMVAQLVIGSVQRGTIVSVDVIGVGSSVYDSLIQQGVNASGINFASASHATDRSGKLKFANARAEYYWKFREALDPDYGNGIALPDDPELLADLCTPRWSITRGGILVESKADIQDRLGRSPDCGDAVVLSWGGASMEEGWELI